MLTMQVTVADLANLRFAISPMWEVVASLRVLRSPGLHAVHLPWVRRHRDQVLGRPEFRELLDLLVLPSSHLPGFPAPAPTSPLADFAAELEGFVRTPARVVRAELDSVFGSELPDSLVPLRRAPRENLPRLASQLERYWELALAPYWSRIHGVLEGDVLHRGQQLANHGPEAMFGSLDPCIGWVDGVVQVDRPHLGQRFDLGGRGLVLVPSAFTWPQVFVKAGEPWQPVIRYSARGFGQLWESPRAASDLSAVLGLTRARLLDELADPATTTRLARNMGLAPGGVSAHLSRLARAGLVARHRIGRQVMYARTERGEALYR